MTTLEAREAALAPALAELRQVLLDWRGCADDAILHLEGLREYPSARAYLEAVEGVRTALDRLPLNACTD